MTNLVELGARKPIEHEARKWLIRMDGDEPLTEAERHSLREWMARSPAHRAELTRLTKFWNNANILTELTGEQLPPEGASTKKLPRSGIIPRILMAVSAILASVVVTYTGLRQLGGGTVSRAYETAIGEQKTVVLADGTEIQLNTDSRVEVVYTKDSRTIRLRRGEVHVSAAYDPSRVLEVHAAHSLVRALGTAFDVYIDGQAVEVMVTKGLVEVVDNTDGASIIDAGDTAKAGSGSSAGGQSKIVRLKENEFMRFASSDGVMPVRQLSDTEVQRRLAWQEGYLGFSGEPLSEVVKAFNRYSLVKFEIGDPELAALSVGGSFRLGDVSAAVELLSQTCGIRARQVNETTIRLESQTKPSRHSGKT